MKIIYNKAFLKHGLEGHCDFPGRLEGFNDIKEIPLDKIPNGEDYLKLVYSDKYINKIKGIMTSIKITKTPCVVSNHVMFTKHTYETACLAVGAAVFASDTNNFAVVRPAGHHAGFHKPQGFCIFNNIAIATQYQLNKGKRVCIIDIDEHHGNGTSEIFYDSDQVLFISIHEECSYPGTGSMDKVGEGKGEGYNINIEVPGGSGDDILLDALITLIPIIKRFKPDIIGISAGFDGHYSDPYSTLNYSEHGFQRFGEIVKCMGVYPYPHRPAVHFRDIFAVLEGGYNEKVLSLCVNSFVKGASSRSNYPLPNGELTKSNKEVIEEYENGTKKKLNSIIDKYWKVK